MISSNVRFLVSVSGRVIGNTQIVIMMIINTTKVNQVLSIINPNQGDITLTRLAGGFRPVSASLSITRLA